MNTVKKQNKELLKVINKLAPWASAAQEDPNCCQKLKDILLEVVEKDVLYNPTDADGLDEMPKRFSTPSDVYQKGWNDADKSWRSFILPVLESNADHDEVEKIIDRIKISNPDLVF